MTKRLKAGDLVILVAATNPDTFRFLGQIHRLSAKPAQYVDEWSFDPPLMLGRLTVEWHSSDMRRIDDLPGNESFVIEARKKLKGKTEITERGEIA